MIHYTVLGRSHYTLAIICDILHLMHGSDYKLTVVSNIKDHENESFEYPFCNDSVEIISLESSDWENNRTNTNYILGVMGNARHSVANHFLIQKDVSISQFINLIHPSSVISASTVLGHGVLVGPLVSIAPFTTIGDFVHINRNVSIGHHTTIMQYTRVNAGSTVSGQCTIGENVMLGPNSTILDRIVIGNSSIIGAASLVNKNIPDHVVAYGNPTKVIREIDH